MTSSKSYSCVYSGLSRLLLLLTLNINCQLCLEDENGLDLIISFDLANKGSFLIAETENIVMPPKIHFLSIRSALSAAIKLPIATLFDTACDQVPASEIIHFKLNLSFCSQLMKT